MLGANLGTAINPVIEGVSGDDPVARRLPAGNLLNRALGCLVALVLLHRLGVLMVRLDPDPARAVRGISHAVQPGAGRCCSSRCWGRSPPCCASCCPPAWKPMIRPGRAIWIRLRWRTRRSRWPGPSRRRCARPTRWRRCWVAPARCCARPIGAGSAEVRRLDDVLDRLNRAIREYLSELDPDALSEADHRRLSEILTFTTKLEAAGDVIDRDVMGHLAKRLKRGLPTPQAEQAECTALLDRLAATVHAAAAVFMTEDARAARLLVAEKEAFRELEATATAAHFAGLRARPGQGRSQAAGRRGGRLGAASGPAAQFQAAQFSSRYGSGRLSGAGRPGGTAVQPVAGRPVEGWALPRNLERYAGDHLPGAAPPGWREYGGRIIGAPDSLGFGRANRYIRRSASQLPWLFRRIVARPPQSGILWGCGWKPPISS